jgi:hypothetical protein
MCSGSSDSVIVSTCCTLCMLQTTCSMCSGSSGSFSIRFATSGNADSLLAVRSHYYQYALCHQDNVACQRVVQACIAACYTNFIM